MHNKNLYFFLAGLSLALLIVGCSTTAKLRKLRAGDIKAELALPGLTKTNEFKPDLEIEDTDTIKVNMDGHEMVLMKAIRDEETGEMVAHQELKAATVTARFRNVPERRGKVDIEFQIRVPKELADSRWQLRFYPELKYMDKSEDLLPVYVTGPEYRREQLKGHQMYQKFLNSIISDSTRFINMGQLEIFISRNFPKLYAYKDSDEYVSEDEFYSDFGVSEREAIEHYTNRAAIRRNNRKKANRDKMFRKYVKNPIVDSGIRLDTVFTDRGEFVYNYIQTVEAIKGLKKVDVVMSGDIYEGTDRVFRMPESEPVSFYISSVSTLTDNSVHYKTQVIERKAEANMSAFIDFEVGRSDVVTAFRDNRREIARIDRTLRSLLENEVFDLDSIMVTAYASPEGNVSMNNALCSRRAASVCSFFRSHLSEFRDSIRREGGFTVGLDGTTKKNKVSFPNIRFTPRTGGENWNKFDALVYTDEKITEVQKSFYRKQAGITSLDEREAQLRTDGRFYRYCKENIYPRLRMVRFDFHLHRRGMIKDTVHTTVVDTAYMDAVQCIRDREYERALSVLRPYNDYNAAVAHIALFHNESALMILERLSKNAKVNYMLAIVYSRMGKIKNAVQCYMDACAEDHAFVNRGNLDPEISTLIKTYGLNKEPDLEY